MIESGVGTMGTQPLTVNASVRFSSLPSGANTAYIKSARLIRVNNP